MIILYEGIAETSRRKILVALLKGDKGVNSIVSFTKLKQPNVSNHLARLRAKSIVNAERHGREVIYSLSSRVVERLVSSLLLKHESSGLPIDLEALSHEYASATLAGDQDKTSLILEGVFRERVPLIDIYELLISNAMATVSNWRAEGRITEAEEHKAHEVNFRLLDRIQQVVGTKPRAGRTVITGLAPSMRQKLGVTVVSDYLQFSGWRTLSMGPELPVKAFVNCVKSANPDLAVMSLACQEDLPATLELVRALQSARKSMPHLRIAVGGDMDPETISQLKSAGVDFTVKSLRQFAEEVVPVMEKPIRSKRRA